MYLKISIVNLRANNIYYVIITRLDASVMIRKKSIYLRRNCRYILFLGNPKGTFGTLLCSAKCSVLHLCRRGGCENMLLAVFEQYIFADGKITKGWSSAVWLADGQTCSNLWSR